MAKIIGRRIPVWIRQENPRLSGNTSGGMWIRWKSLDYNNKAEHVQNMGAVGRIEDNTGTQVAQRYSETSMEFDFYDEYPQLVANLFTGNSGVVNVGTGVTSGSNLVPANTNEPTTFTIGYSGIDGVSYVSSGNIVKSVAVTGDASNPEFINCSVDFIGTEYVSGTLPALTYITDSKKFIPADVTFTLNSGTTAANQTRNIKSFTYSAERNADADYSLGSVSPINFFAKQLQYKLEATVNSDSADNTDANSGFYRQYYQSGTDVVGRIRMTNSRVLSGTTNPIFTAEYRGNVTDYKEDTPLDDIVTQTFTVTGSRRLSTGFGMVAFYVQSGNYT